MTAQALEREILDDVGRMGDRLADEQFCGDLYRALARNVWTKDGFDGTLSVSFGRAEEVVNELRARHGREPITLAQTGDEVEVSSLIADELGRSGWRFRALDTTEHEPDHLVRPESPPPAGQGERRAPVADSGAWKRQAHEEADEALRERR